MGRTLNLLLLLPLLALQTGCGLTGTRPSLEVSDARVAARTQEAILLEFAVEGKNMGDEPLPLRNVEYALSIDGRVVFRGSRAGERTLPAEGMQTVVLPASVRLEDLPDDGSVRYVLSGLIEYSKPGALADVLFDAKLVRPKAPFSDRGVIELGDAPTATTTMQGQ